MSRTEIDIADVELIPSEGSEHSRAAEGRGGIGMIVPPILFLAVTMLGGMRLAPKDNSFIFLAPELIALVLSSLTMILIFRSELLSFSGWFRHDDAASKKLANGAILLSLFTATCQVFNSLLPEKGMLHWIFVFCFFWAIVTGLLSDLPARRVVISLATLFAIAFVVKYIFLAGLASPADTTWLQRVWEDPGREAIAMIFGKPEFSPATGFLQFFALAIYFWGLWLLPQRN
jgi:hypothetical protein